MGIEVVEWIEVALGRGM